MNEFAVEKKRSGDSQGNGNVANNVLAAGSEHLAVVEVPVRDVFDRVLEVARLAHDFSAYAHASFHVVDGFFQLISLDVLFLDELDDLLVVQGVGTKL